MFKVNTMCPHTTRITFSCSSIQECLEIAEAITKIRGLKAPLVKHRIKKTSVEVTITGSSAEITLTKRLVVKAVSQVKKSTRHSTNYTKPSDSSC
ncbi:MAG: hypothetical protein ACP5KB_02735 [Thermoprotei archaeon]